MIKLGSIVTDSATGNSGMVTHLQVEMNGQKHYIFQPTSLNPETGQPVSRLWVVESRLVGGSQIPEPSLPINVLGTEVEDQATGFKGTAISLQLHISGCVHIEVQPKGVLAKTGAAIESVDFDIRRLKGASIPSMTEQEREADQQQKPSPGRVEKYVPSMMR